MLDSMEVFVADGGILAQGFLKNSLDTASEGSRKLLSQHRYVNFLATKVAAPRH